VPVLAAWLADVLVVHPLPLVRDRVRDHLLDQLAVLLLHVADVVEAGSDVLHPRGQAVAHAFELVDGEDARTPEPGDREVDAAAREGRAEQAGQRELQRGDLAPQVGARRALVVLVEDCVEALGRGGRNQRLLRGEHLGDFGAFEQLRHTCLLYESSISLRPQSASRHP
jgi:hypothetical protein